MKKLFLTGLAGCGFKIIIFFLVISIGPFFLSLAWNYVMPSLFGLSEIGWLQSFCLILIGHLIFPTSIGSNKN